jgi:hypothetical protein
MSQAMELDRDLEANPNRISQTPTIVNSVRYGPGSSTTSLKQRDSNVPEVPAVPSTYTRQNSDTGSIKTDKAELDDEQYGEKDDDSNEPSESQDSSPPGLAPNEEGSDIVTWDSDKDPEMVCEEPKIMCEARS